MQPATTPISGRPRRYLTAASAPSTDRGRAKLFFDRAAAELALRHLPAALRATAATRRNPSPATQGGLEELDLPKPRF